MRLRILNPTLLLILFGCAIAAQAETPQQISQFRPADASLPPRNEDGGSRGVSLFSPQQPPLTALTPTQGGVTVEEYPTFFVFVPQAEEATENLSAEFVITDKQDNIIYETTLKLPQKASLVRINLPKTATPLELDQLYQWYFSVRSNLETVNTVFGSIKRVQPSPMLLEAIQNTRPETLPEVYADSGIWYETLLAIVELRQANPNDTDLQDKWQRLLKSVGLEKIANLSLFSITPTSLYRPADSENPFAPSINTPLGESIPDRFNPADNKPPSVPDGGSRFNPADYTYPPGSEGGDLR